MACYRQKEKARARAEARDKIWSGLSPALALALCLARCLPSSYIIEDLYVKKIITLWFSFEQRSVAARW